MELYDGGRSGLFPAADRDLRWAPPVHVLPGAYLASSDARRRVVVLIREVRESGSAARDDLLVAVRVLCLREIVSGLQVEPKARIGAEIASQPNSSISGDVACAAHDLGEPVGRNIQFLRERARRKAEGNEIFLPQHFAGVCP